MNDWSIPLSTLIVMLGSVAIAQVRKGRGMTTVTTTTNTQRDCPLHGGIVADNRAMKEALERIENAQQKGYDRIEGRIENIFKLVESMRDRSEWTR